MGLPNILEVAGEYLFADENVMIKNGVSELSRRHILRLRDMYNYWLAFPSKRDRDIVAELQRRYGIGETVARQDLRAIKTLLGDLNKVSKDYMRYVLTQRLNRAFEKADAAGNTRDMIASAVALGKIHQLDKDDERANILDKVVPVVLTFTDDPSVIGIKPTQNLDEKIRKLKEKYWSEATEEVDFEDVDAQFDQLFLPHGKEIDLELPKDGNSKSTGVS